ncbi:hypothetical protein NDU88_000758 [Pleurodeles waltl]|uniref:Uncharacterized protein n=1 Tax=Pleurodeles waltl TaxID=8319 RepID=A0AAV7MIG1_PLEWA|nr:hypothetical protein NDU88_000758 [Pleurodeles waltl]
MPVAARLRREALLVPICDSAFGLRRRRREVPCPSGPRPDAHAAARDAGRTIAAPGGAWAGPLLRPWRDLCRAVRLGPWAQQGPRLPGVMVGPAWPQEPERLVVPEPVAHWHWSCGHWSQLSRSTILPQDWGKEDRRCPVPLGHGLRPALWPGVRSLTSARGPGLARCHGRGETCSVWCGLIPGPRGARACRGGWWCLGRWPTGIGAVVAGPGWGHGGPGPHVKRAT